MERNMEPMMKGDNFHGTLLWISNVTGKIKRYVGLLLVVQVILGISSVVYALALREIINRAVAADWHGFFIAIISFIGLIVFQIILRAMDRFLNEFTCATMENHLKSRLFSILLTKDYFSVTKVHSGEWMNRLTSDTVVVAEGITQILPGITSMTVKMIGAFTAILWLEPRFFIILIPGGAFLVFFTYLFRKILKQLHKKIREADGRLRVFLSERLGNLMIIRTFGREKQMAKEAEMLMEQHKKARINRNYFSNICNIGFGVAMNGAYVLGAVFCGYGILTKTMSYGNFMAILQLIGQIQNPFANITGFLPKYYAMLASAERLIEAEKYKDDSSKIFSHEKIKTFYLEEFQCLGLEKAAFTYQHPVAGKNRNVKMPIVLSEISLVICKGEYVAFTGPSGCGKSTVLKLLMCLYPLDHGERYIKGKERWSLNGIWRGLFAYVPQGNQLLCGTIREILTFGEKEKMSKDEELWQALKIACADVFVASLEQGMDTLLGERGTGLSEGQMQRIAIARAIFSDHPILLLDEATSSLDEETEAKLLYNLREMTDKTVIIVTHRPQALKICDRQINFNDMGKVKNEGTKNFVNRADD